MLPEHPVTTRKLLAIRDNAWGPKVHRAAWVPTSPGSWNRTSFRLHLDPAPSPTPHTLFLLSLVCLLRSRGMLENVPSFLETPVFIPPRLQVCEAACGRAVFSVSYSGAGQHLRGAAQVAGSSWFRRSQCRTCSKPLLGQISLSEGKKTAQRICTLGHRLKLLSMPFLTKAKTSPHLLIVQGVSVLYY